MTDNDVEAIHTDQAISQYFQIEAHILATRSADAYKAIDRSRNAPVCLWVMRHPFALRSDTVRRFLARMHKIDSIEPPVSDALAFGVDSQGIAFSLFPPLDGYTINSGNIEISEAERRFIAAVKVIDRLHFADIACGDLCSSSFWVNREGDVSLLGVMGSFDAEAASTAMSPPAETLPYLAPEQRGLGAVEPASDVFALGVLGYFLFTRRYPYGEGIELFSKALNLSTVTPLSKAVGVPPVWAEEVISRCINPSSKERYQNAGEILLDIKEIRNRAFSEESTPARRGEHRPDLTQEDKSKIRAQASQFKSIAVRPSDLPEETRDYDPFSKRRKLILVGAGGLILLLLVLVLPGLLREDIGPAGPSALETQLMQYRDATTDEGLKHAIDVLAVDQREFQEKIDQIQQVEASDDPLAHEILVKSAREADSTQLRDIAEAALVSRARRLGLLRSAEQVRQWLRTLRSDQYPDSYEAMLKVIDISLPEEVRFSLLRQAYASQPLVALRLSVALAIDLDRLDAFQPLIAQLVGDSLRITELSQYSTLSLILAHHDLSLVFGEDIVQRRDQIPDGDLIWLLRLLAERNDVNVRAIANMAVDRGVLSSVRQVFLGIVRDRGDLPGDVLRTLIRAAAGVVTGEDLASIGRWYDVAAERVLLAVLADSYGDSVLREAFDLLAGKSPTIQPSGALTEWVKKNHWDRRAEFAPIVGILGNLEYVSDQQVEQAFGVLDTIGRDTSLLEILLDANQPMVVKQILDRYSDLLGLGVLLNLLSHPDSEVRIAAVRSLRGFNDIGALKIIIDHYERERNAAVKAAYEDTFWVIRQRTGRGD